MSTSANKSSTPLEDPKKFTVSTWELLVAYGIGTPFGCLFLYFLFFPPRSDPFWSLAGRIIGLFFACWIFHDILFVPFTLRITDHGVEGQSILHTRSIPWEEIQEIEVKRTYSSYNSVKLYIRGRKGKIRFDLGSVGGRRSRRDLPLIKEIFKGRVPGVQANW